jgi:hypothetical protein
MATDDDRQAVETTEFQKKLDVMVATAVNAKKYDAARTRVLAATTLLEEEKCAATILVEEARAAAAQIKPPSLTSPPGPVGRVAPSDDDYEIVVIANIHV